MKKKAKAEKPYVSPQDKVPFKEQLAYACGALMDGGGVALMACVLLKYMTDTLGIAAAAASTIMMVSKIWDAITDPIMGYISDNTRSRFGRRKPYMIVGGAALIIALLLLFAPLHKMGIQDQAGMIAWMLIFYIFWNTCSTCSQVPYTSMASDLTPNYHERNNANTVKLVFSSAAAGLAYVVPLLLLSAVQEKGQINTVEFWIIMVVLFGTLFGGGLIVTGVFTKERVKPSPTEKREKFDFKQFLKGYITPYKNKSCAWHIGMYVAAFTCMDMLSALAAYYASHVWRGEVIDLGFTQKNFGSMFIVAPLAVAAVIAFPLVRVVMDKKGKGFAFRMGLPFYIIGGILIAVIDPSWCPAIVVPIVAFIMGFGFGGAQMIPWMNFPDTLDVAELKMGKRPTGNYSGMMTLVRKVSGALGVGIIGWVLTGVGYDEYNAAIRGAEALAKTDEAFRATFESAHATNIGEVLVNNEGAITQTVQQLFADGKLDIDMSKFNVVQIGTEVDNVLLTIRILLGVSIAVLIAVAMFCSFKFKLNNKILARMRYFSDKVKAGEFDTLTDEEKEERIQLIKKHYGKYDAEQDAQMIEEMRVLALQSQEQASREEERVEEIEACEGDFTKDIAQKEEANCVDGDDCDKQADVQDGEDNE